jgi:hypothetical protein
VLGVPDRDDVVSAVMPILGRGTRNGRRSHWHLRRYSEPPFIDAQGPRHSI